MYKARRFFLILLSAVVALGLTACSSADVSFFDRVFSVFRQQKPGEGAYGSLTPSGLVQVIAVSLQNPNQAEMNFERIPDRQRSGLSDTEYTRYINFLRQGVLGSLESYNRMNPDEERIFQKDLSATLPDDQALIQSLQGFWLHYQEAGSRQGRFAIPIQLTPDGMPVLPQAYIRRILELRAFADLYFQAMVSGDLDALSYLSRFSPYSDPVTRTRAEQLITFYRSRIVSRPADFRLVYARLDRIVLETYYTDSRTGRQQDHQIQFLWAPEGAIRVVEQVEHYGTVDDRTVLLDGGVLTRIGGKMEDASDRLTSQTLPGSLGVPEEHSDANCNPISADKRRISLRFDNLEIILDGTCDRHREWSGRVFAVVLDGPRVKLASGPYIGMPRDELLMIYPFLNESNDQFIGTGDEGQLIEWHFRMVDERLAAIEIGVSHN